jgi:hypothetical protein
MEGSKPAAKPGKSKRPYLWPIVLMICGTILPLVIGGVLTARGLNVPQCPTNVTQVQIDSGNCIIGANMSGIYIILALPFVFLSLVSAIIWMLIIWRKSRH